MRICRFLWEGRARAGGVVGGNVILLASAAGVASGRLRLRGIEDLFGLPDERIGEIEEGLVRLMNAGLGLGVLDEEAGVVRIVEELAGDGGESAPLLPPVAPVRNIVCIGKNYRAHVNEVAGTAIGRDTPEAPVVFTKATTAVIGPGGTIPAHRDVTRELDYEGEIAVILGRGGRRIPVESAWDHVFGLTLINDVTARDLQRRHRQFFLGKSLDGAAPLGPVIVHRSALPPVEEITLTTAVNGERRQEGRLSDLIFDVPTLIATLSAGMTLLPGDIIATGTPAGVGGGFDPPRFLAPGDVVEVASPAIGRLVNRVGGDG